MKKLVAFLFVAFVSHALLHAQGKSNITNPIIKKEFKNLDDVAPKDWVIIRADSGDFNDDHVSDYTLIVEPDKDYLNTNGFDTKLNAPPRILLIAFGRFGTDSLDLSLRADSAIMRSNSGEGDPLAQGTGLKTDGSIFEINFAGGISVQWTALYRFMYKNKEWTLAYYKGTEYNTSDEEAPIKTTEVDFNKKFVKQDKLKTPMPSLQKIYLSKFAPRTTTIMPGVVL